MTCGTARLDEGFVRLACAALDAGAFMCVGLLHFDVTDGRGVWVGWLDGWMDSGGWDGLAMKDSKDSKGKTAQLKSRLLQVPSVTSGVAGLELRSLDPLFIFILLSSRFRRDGHAFFSFLFFFSNLPF